MEERIRRTLHEVAGLLENMAEEDLKLVEEIEKISRDPGSLLRKRMRKKLEAIRDSANRIRKETKR